MTSQRKVDQEKGQKMKAKQSLNLPKPIAAYFAADKIDGEAVSRRFTENAIVTDEGVTHKGRAAIKQWKTDASGKYQYTSEPFACEQKEGKTVVTSRLTGNFRQPCRSSIRLRTGRRQGRVFE